MLKILIQSIEILNVPSKPLYFTHRPKSSQLMVGNFRAGLHLRMRFIISFRFAFRLHGNDGKPEYWKMKTQRYQNGTF